MLTTHGVRNVWLITRALPGPLCPSPPSPLLAWSGGATWILRVQSGRTAVSASSFRNTLPQPFLARAPAAVYGTAVSVVPADHQFTRGGCAFTGWPSLCHRLARIMLPVLFPDPVCQVLIPQI
eukprot:EG_transcript_28761